MNNNEPVVLGKVKKGGTGKPILVIIILLFIGATIFLLPTILSYFGDYNIIDLIKNGEIVDFIQNHDKYMNGNVSLKNDKKEEQTTQVVTNNYINNKTIINGNGFTLTDFDLTTDSISFNINNTSSIDFDNEYYYLTLTKNNNVLAVIKIDTSNKIEYKFKNKLDNTLQIEGNLKKYNDNDYPKYTLSSDESGLATIYCNLNNDYYEYMFDNNKLLKIKQKYTYYDNGNNKDYLKEFEKYTTISNKINNSNNKMISSSPHLGKNDIKKGTYIKHMFLIL